MALLHQSPSSGLMYETLIPLLPQQLRIIAPDTPGFGASSDLAGEITIEALADEIVDALLRIDSRPWHLFGHHTGSIISMQIAHAGVLPLASLTLSGPPCLDDELRQLLTDLYRPPTDIDAHVIGGWERIRSAADDVPLELLMRDFAQSLLVRRLPAVYAAATRFDPIGALSNVTVPAMILAGEQDPIKRGFGQIRAALPHARYVSMEQGGIQMCEIQAGEMAGYLTEFFTAVAA
ncbi:MAG TPA: alpha/beta fold hydrolase [Micromonosporaceae bacterium]